MASGTQKVRISPRLRRIALIALGCIVIVMLLVAIAPPTIKSQANNFEECIEHGGNRMESYPEQCAINGKTFTNTSQSIQADDYIGLSETEASRRAKDTGRSYRVVERDGERVPVTMDFSPGRLNFVLEDGIVARVEVEGDDQ